jgi:hypothetical protein
MKTLAVHCHCDVCSAAGGHSAECRTSWVCLLHHVMWSHLMMLQYMAASSHLPSVSTANINTMQYLKPYKQYQIPKNPAPMISKMLLPQSNIMAAYVHSNSKSLSGSSPGLPTYNIHNVTQYTFLFSAVGSC